MPQLIPDPRVIARVRELELSARRAVEGLLAGRHRSPRHGFAVEFAQHREYAPGDDLKHVDWKVLARTERYFLKQYELETDLTVWLMVDASRSMAYGSSGTTKYDYAALCAAALASLALRQADAAGLVAFDGSVLQVIRPSGKPSQFREILTALAQGPTGAAVGVGAALAEAAARLGRRGLVLIFSDLFDDPPALLAGLKRLRHDRHEVVLFQTLDPAELEFPFADPTLFRGLELPEQLLTDPRSLRSRYRRELAEHRGAIARGCRDLGADFVDLRTDEDAGLALARHLYRRSGRST